MLNAAIHATFRLLFFRAGPQDFPYVGTPALTRGCAAYAIAAIALPQLVVSPPAPAVLFAASVVLGIFVFVRLVLRFRKLDNRVQQTFNALVTAIGTLWLLALPAWAAVLPAISTMQQKLMADPAIADSPERVAALQAEMQAGMPPSAALLIFIVFIWLFAVTGRVLGQATDSGTFGGVGLALLCGFNLFAFLLFVEPLLRLLGG